MLLTLDICAKPTRLCTEDTMMNTLDKIGTFILCAFVCFPLWMISKLCTEHKVTKSAWEIGDDLDAS